MLMTTEGDLVLQEECSARAVAVLISSVVR